jgi:hypothetical protein
MATRRGARGARLSDRELEALLEQPLVFAAIEAIEARGPVPDALLHRDNPRETTLASSGTIAGLSSGGTEAHVVVRAATHSEAALGAGERLARDRAEQAAGRLAAALPDAVDRPRLDQIPTSEATPPKPIRHDRRKWTFSIVEVRDVGPHQRVRRPPEPPGREHEERGFGFSASGSAR